jgi:hypothetical protein
MARRAPLILVALLLASGTLMWLAFGRGSATAQPVRAATARHTTCDERPLAYGLSDDREAGRAYESQALFGAHPPLPRPGYYAPADTPAPDVILHALSHRWVVIKYRPGVDAQALPAGPRTLVVSGGAKMPFPLGAVAWGRQLTCRASDLKAVAGFARRNAG